MRIRSSSEVQSEDDPFTSASKPGRHQRSGTSASCDQWQPCDGLSRQGDREHKLCRARIASRRLLPGTGPRLDCSSVEFSRLAKYSHGDCLIRQTRRATATYVGLLSSGESTTSRRGFPPSVDLDTRISGKPPLSRARARSSGLGPIKSQVQSGLMCLDL